MTARRSRRNAQGSWDAIRSQVMLHLSRCSPAAERPEVPTKQIFAADLLQPYYGPTRAARETVNRILGLASAAGQAEWEAELDEPANVELSMDALGDVSLDIETRSAIALMITDRLDRAAGQVPTELLTRMGWLLRRDPQIQARMRYFWSRMDASAALMQALG